MAIERHRTTGGSGGLPIIIRAVVHGGIVQL